MVIPVSSLTLGCWTALGDCWWLGFSAWPAEESLINAVFALVFLCQMKSRFTSADCSILGSLSLTSHRERDVAQRGHLVPHHWVEMLVCCTCFTFPISSNRASEKLWTNTFNVDSRVFKYYTWITSVSIHRCSLQFKRPIQITSARWQAPKSISLK